jgi:hypothetical protein
MRRALAAVALVAVSSVAWLAPADAHGDYSGGWTDPAPGDVLDGRRGISGSVGHAHGIQSVSLGLVSPVDAEAPPECAPEGAPWEPIAGGGAQQVSFTFDVGFPCNIDYRVEAQAQAGAGEGTRFEPDPAPAPFSMSSIVSVAIPAEPVQDLALDLDGPAEDRNVVLTWSPGAEPDIVRYIISRDGDELGEVVPGEELTFVDASPTPGSQPTYEVTAVRSGPDGEIAGRPASASIEVPERPSEDDADADGGDPDDGDGDGGGGGDGASPTDGGTSGTSGGTSGIRLPAPTSRPASGGGPPTTLDTGFQETLPFGAQPEQEVAAPPPARDGSVVASFDDADEPPVLNQETWTFIAAGLALLMGSMVIRHVTRRAAAGY